MRRRLLPLSALRAFEVAARRGSVKGAAQEMGVTDSAISRQVGELETFVGCPLFIRSGRGVALTEAGSALSEQLTRAFDLMTTSVEAAQSVARGRFASATSEVRPVRARAVTKLAARVLLPGIAAFEREYPQIELSLTVSEAVATGPSDDADVVLSYTREAPSERVLVLFRDEAEPLASPETVAMIGGELRPARVLRRARLLGATPTWWDWRAWAEAQGAAWPPAATLMTFETDDLAIQAAVAGAGVVLADPRLAGRDLAEARLVRVLPRCQPTPMGWYVASLRENDDAAATAFLAWLQEALTQPPALTPAPSPPAPAAPPPGSAPEPPGPPGP